MPPVDGTAPTLFSLPRDLWVTNPCNGTMNRINAGLDGCGSEVSGPELMAVMMEDAMAIPIDHYLQEVVEALGGVTICNDHPVRDGCRPDGWSLPAGGVAANGDEALGWVRSRRTEELADGAWRPQACTNDLTP